MTTVTLPTSFASIEALAAAYRAAGGTIGDVVTTVASDLMVDCDADPNHIMRREGSGLGMCI